MRHLSFGAFVVIGLILMLLPSTARGFPLDDSTSSSTMSKATQFVGGTISNALEQFTEAPSYVKIGASVVAGAVIGVVAVPAAISAVGFTSSGVAAGSIAASIQSTVYAGSACGWFATAQSIGAAGMGLTGTVVSAVSGAAVTGTAAYATANDERTN
eukprot:ANDGO_02220.mRNA.1 hypothetical protein